MKHSTSPFYEVIYFNEWVVIKQGCEKLILTILTPTPQNGQTHSNNSSATADELFECF